MSIRDGYDSATVRYLTSREQVLGQMFSVHGDAELAADDIADRLGSRALAYRWCLDVLDALDGRGSAA